MKVKMTQILILKSKLCCVHGRTRRHLPALVLFGFLSLLYCRLFLFSSAEYLPGQSIFSDFYLNFLVWKEQLSMLRNQFIPLGVYWFPSYFGGFRGMIIPNQGLGDIPNLLSLILYAVTEDHVLAVKQIIFFSVFSSSITSYFYGYQIFSRRDASVLFSVGYSFSSYYLTEIYYGHLNFLVAAGAIPLVLYVWESYFSQSDVRHAAWAGLSLVLLFFIEWQILFFAMLFVFFRFLYICYGKFRTTELSKTVVNSIISALVFLMCIFPFILPYLFSYSLWRAPGGEPAYLYFMRLNPLALTDIQMTNHYVGVSILVLALIPMFARNKPSATSSLHKRQYFFFLFVCIFYVMYSTAQYSPINVAGLLHKIIPLASFIGAVHRSSIFVFLSVSVCCSIGYITLTENLSSFMSTQKVSKLSSRTVRRLVRRFLPILLCMLIFLDLSYDLEPRTTSMFIPSSFSYDFLRQQSSEFRVVEIPACYGLPMISSRYISHEVLDWRYPYTGSPSSFSQLYSEFVDLAENLFIKNGDFVGNVSADWKIVSSENCEVLVEKTSAMSLIGNSSLMVFLESSRKYDFVKIEQELVNKPVLTDNMFLSIALYAQSFKNSTLDVIVGLRNKVSSEATTVIYTVANGSLGASGTDSTRIVVQPNLLFWEKLHRKLLADLPEKNRTKTWQIEKLSFLIRNTALNGVQNRIRVFFDMVSIHKITDIIAKATLYGVRYVLVHTNETFFEKWNGSPGLIERNNALDVKFYLSLIDDFKEVLHDDDIYLYENRNFRGMVFAIKNNSTVEDRLNSNALLPANASVNYKRKDPNTIFISVTAGEPCLLLISQNFDEGWRALDQNQIFTIRKIFGISGIHLAPGNYSISLHFSYYEESLLLFPAFYIPLLLIFSLSILEWRRRPLNKRALKGLIILPLSIYSPTVIALSLFLYKGFYNLYFAGRFIEHGPELSPFGNILMWFGILVVVGTALLSLLLEAKEAKLLSTQLIVLIGASSLFVIKVWLDLQDYAHKYWALFLLIVAFTASSLLILQHRRGAMTLRESSTFFDFALRLTRYGKSLPTSFIDRLEQNRFAMLLFPIISLFLILLSPFLNRTIGGVWYSNAFLGYALYLTPPGEIILSLGTLIIVGLAFYSFWLERSKSLFTTQTILITSALLCLYFRLRIAAEGYIFVSQNPLENDLLLMTIFSFLTSLLFIAQYKSGPLVISNSRTIHEFLLTPPLGILAILTISLTFLATLIQYFWAFIALLLANCAFYLFIALASLYFISHARLMKRFRQASNSDF